MACFVPLFILYQYKEVVYDSRFGRSEDLWQFVFYAAMWLVSAVSVLHIRPVYMPSQPAVYGDILGFSQGITLFFLF